MIYRSSSERSLPFCPVLLLVSLIVLGASRASPRSSYALFHRLGLPSTDYSNNQTSYEWQKRAVLEISVAGTSPDDSTPPPTDLHFVISSFTKNPEPLKIPSALPLESLDYQISLLPQDSQELPGEFGHPDTGFATTSYPLCDFLSDRSSSPPGPQPEYLNIWIRPTAIAISRSDSHPNPIHNLQLDLLGIQWASSSFVSAPSATGCHSNPDRAGSSDHHSSIISTKLDTFINHHGRSSIKVSARKPEKLVEPILKLYPTQRSVEYLPDGTIKAPPPEKGFLAKYWMYILPVVVLLVMGGGPASEEAAGAEQPPPP